MNTQSTTSLEKFAEWRRNSKSLKLIGIGIIILLLMIPLDMITRLIRERVDLKNNVQYEIAGNWARAQQLSGPIITVPFDWISTSTNSLTGEILESRTRRHLHFLPENLDINSEITPVDRYLGIYHTTVYESGIDLSGQFAFPEHALFNDPHVSVLWDEVLVSFGIPDLRGVQNELKLDFDGLDYTLRSGMSDEAPIASGVGTRIILDPDDPHNLEFSMVLDLKGSFNLSFDPLARTTQVTARSSWTAPSYFGSFLPDTHNEDTSNGFEAHWKILDINRNIPQSFETVPKDLRSHSFGVNLFEEVNHYTSTERSAKYAMLLIFLTFLTFFIIMLVRKIRIHPVQFLFVGLALCVFYVLLLALSEQIGFSWAYLAAAAANCILISLYMKAAFKSSGLAAIVMLVTSLLYLFIYIIIQLANYSLLAGSIGLFAALAIMMFASRNMDWYALRSEPQTAEV
ncbi:MAG: cell envelope integrity protein CreD [Flavobacteriales bacterium]|nr:cell envelope integrity protein CreD [Flavobacteriales bacterium]